MSGPVTVALGVDTMKTTDGLIVCVGCGATVYRSRAGLAMIHHWAPCAEAERVIGDREA